MTDSESSKAKMDDPSEAAVDSQIEFFKGITSSMEKRQDGLDQIEVKLLKISGWFIVCSVENMQNIAESEIVPMTCIVPKH